MVRTSPTFRRRRLARRIRYLRERAGLTQEHAACELDMSTSALSRKENGDVITSVHEARSMVDLYDIRDPELLDLARAARERGWWRAYGVADRGYVDLETEACAVQELSLMYIPGLLQTEEYMRAIFVADSGMRPERNVENDVSVRTIRQRRLADPEQPLELTALVDQAALERPIGGPQVMRDQLRHLLEVVQLDRVELRILPKATGCHLGMAGAFVVLEFPEPEDNDVLFVSHPVGSVHVEKAGEVQQARVVFERLFAQALPAEQSMRLIERAAAELQ
ncbi:XRE family transcriptional regulator [Actinopolyspora erythraea]|uniref:XRE family transcriptional regulator n=1 Tax=Actinopolyspora erythraea TaxID=414996 RepID=A0A099D9Y6_9ACTN|nr:helix-turn-helix transcriptional regulator [Actinopolyspora erythraea]ASU80599.1 XRE family transcriptional regulator [Actinopolyspora erythraea]KGI82721.1 XRE family transcriptional regulator [Actinopolyspora erythraea]